MESLNDSLQNTLDAFDYTEPLTTQEVAARLDLNRRTVYARLDRLVEQGLLATKKVGAHARIWWRPEPEFASEVDAQDLLYHVLDNVAVGMFVFDPDSRVAWTNAITEEFFGFDREDVLGHARESLITEQIAPHVEDADAYQDAVLAHGEDDRSAEQFECKIECDNGTRWLEYQRKPIAVGELAGGWVELYYDISDFKQSQAAAHERFEELRSLIDAVEEYAIFTLDADGYVKSWNPGARQIKGYEAEEIIGEHFSNFYTDADRQMGIPDRNLREAAERGSVEDEGWRVRDDGSRFWANVTISAIRDADGRLTGFAKVTRDMTQQREHKRRLEMQADRLERQREELEEELNEIFQRIDDAFLALDEEWRITYVNDRAAELLRTSPGKLLGAEVWDILEEFEDALRDIAEEAMDQQESTESEFFSEPLETWFEVRCHPSDTGMSLYFRDVTERKSQELELRETNAKLEAATRAGEVATWDWDIQADRFFMGEWFAELFDIDPDAAERGVSLDDVLAGIHEADRDRVRRSIESTIEVCGEFEEEYRVIDASGDRRWVVARGQAQCDADGNPLSFPGIVTDITDRKLTELASERRREQQRAIADLGQLALETDDPDELMATVARRVADILDNTYCKVLDLDAEAGELLLRQGVGWDEGIVGEATVSATDNSQAGYTLISEEPVVVEDLASEERFSGPELLTSHDVVSGISTIIGPADDPWGILGTHDTSQREFTQDDVNFVQSVANVLASAIDRLDHEQELERQRDQLLALNNLNAVVSEITDIVIERSTRMEIEQGVCDALASSEAYKFAWFAEVEPSSTELRPRATAGTGGYVDDISVSIDTDDPGSQGPGAQAIRTQTTQVVQDVFSDPSFEPWREAAEEYGFRAAASIPVVHEGTIYGVLALYTDRSNAFDEGEFEVIDQIGRVVGHAIAAAERRRTLMSDELVEVEFHLPDVIPDLEGVVDIHHAIPIGDEEFLIYGSTSPETFEAFADAVTDNERWEILSSREHDGSIVFEQRIRTPPAISAIDEVGGSIEHANFTGGDLRMQVHLAPSVDVRRLIESVEAARSGAEMVRREQISRERHKIDAMNTPIESELTDRQREVLEVSLYSGYFEWPRTASGEEVADVLDIAPATFSQHLRRAQKRVFESLFSVGEAEGQDE